MDLTPMTTRAIPAQSADRRHEQAVRRVAAVALCLGVAGCSAPPPPTFSKPVAARSPVVSPAPPPAPVAVRRPAPAACFETSITAPQPFLGNHGEVFRLADGSVWEVQFEYRYFYEYLPQVVICPASGRLIVRGASLNVSPISSAPRAGQRAAPAASGIIESRIEGEFQGWDGETIFRLQNGQIWQQTSYAYHYHYAYGPRVTIIPSAGGHEMMVEGVNSRIRVQPLR